MIKKSLTVCKTAYLQWIGGYRILIFIFSYMFMYVYFIQPFEELSKMLDTPINAIEPFVSMMNNSYFLPLIAITYMILICDQPRLNDHSTFVIFRTGRMSYILGQVFFLISSALTFIGFLLISSMLTIADNSFFINAWSLISKKCVVKSFLDNLSSKYKSAVLSGSVVNQSRPIEALIHAICLMLLFMLIVGLIMIIFSLYSKKIIAVFLNMVFAAAGLFLNIIDIKVKWLLPISNSAFNWHYDEMYNKTIVSITYSYVYFIVLCAIMLFIAFRIGKKCSFHIVGGTE